MWVIIARRLTFKRLDPIGALLGMAADLRDIWCHNEGDRIPKEELETAIFGSIIAVASNFTTKTYMQGLADFFSIVANPYSSEEGMTKRMSNYIGKQIGSFVPAGVAGVEQMAHPTTTEVFDILDCMKGRLPGISQSMAAKKDVFGEDIETDLPFLNFISPMTMKRSKGDKAYSELGRLNYDVKNSIGAFKRIDGHDLSPEQYTRMSELFGKPLKQTMDNLVNSAEYDAADDGDPDTRGTKRYMIKTAMLRHKQQATAALMQEYPDLYAAIKTKTPKFYSASN